MGLKRLPPTAQDLAMRAIARSQLIDMLAEQLVREALAEIGHNGIPPPAAHSPLTQPLMPPSTPYGGA